MPVMRGHSSERGAVAVLTGLVMLVLVGFVALSIDIGMARVLRVNTQNAADATALAIAARCAGGDCGDIEATCTQFAEGNSAQYAYATVDPENKIVTVRASVDVLFSFGRLFGRDGGTITSQAAARWDTPKPRLVA